MCNARARFLRNLSKNSFKKKKIKQTLINFLALEDSSIDFPKIIQKVKIL